MKEVATKEITTIFFQALEYPEFARSNFYLQKQAESKWARGVYLNWLSEIYHDCIFVLQFKFGAAKRLNPDLKLEDFKLKVGEIFSIENDTILDKNMLDELFYSIQRAYNFLRPQPNFTPYQIISFVEKALLFILQEFNEQIGKNISLLGRPRTTGTFTYFIAQDAPFFDFPKFKNAAREVLYSARNLGNVLFLLTSFYKIASEIVKLWNEEIYFLAERRAKSGDFRKDLVRVEFLSETLNYLWWSDEKMFDKCKSYSINHNQDLAEYAAKIANLINGEIIHAQSLTVKVFQKDFISDLVDGIRYLESQGQSEICIKNVIDGRLLESPFRDYFSTWLSGRYYKTNRESLKGTKHIDLKVEHDSIETKIIEFKGWWNSGIDSIIDQISNYLSAFEENGYIIIINSLQKNINDQYRKIVCRSECGYVSNSWLEHIYAPTAFKYFSSQHKLGSKSVRLNHFILNIDFPKQVHRKIRSIGQNNSKLEK